MHQSEVNEIAGTHLGKTGGYSDQYDPSLLVAVPRYLNREDHGIKNYVFLPFVGGDVWNCYEVSVLTQKGLPVNAVLKLYYSSDSEFHVESKSLKLYLNSFNMTKLGPDASQSLRQLEALVAADLETLLKTEVQVHAFPEGTLSTNASALMGFRSLKEFSRLEDLEFTSYKMDDTQLLIKERSIEPKTFRVTSDLLRSNCRVTGQPDWGDVYLVIKGRNHPNFDSLAKYIVSHRQVNHFHEEVCEMMFVHLLEAYKPEKMMLACLYTRRGGLDINPVRATHLDMIPPQFINVERFHGKTIRQ